MVYNVDRFGQGPWREELGELLRPGSEPTSVVPRPEAPSKGALTRADSRTNAYFMMGPPSLLLTLSIGIVTSEGHTWSVTRPEER